MSQISSLRKGCREFCKRCLSSKPKKAGPSAGGAGTSFEDEDPEAVLTTLSPPMTVGGCVGQPPTGANPFTVGKVCYGTTKRLGFKMEPVPPHKVWASGLVSQSLSYHNTPPGSEPKLEPGGLA